jgi:hydroxymethylpyrimidine/phosphomethylpyrimidine kinase
LERKESPAGKEFSKQYYEYIKELKEIGKVGVDSPDAGISLLTNFISCLPKPLKNRVNSVVDPIMESSYGDSLALKMAIDKISTLLFECLIGENENAQINS